MLHSRNRLLGDIERWQGEGWITPQGADAIRAEIAARRSKLGLAGVLSILAAVLVGAGVMSFVAANWQEMSKLLRLAVIFTGMWAAFAGAVWLRRFDHPAFAEAALLAGVGIFGAGIMLIAQMYHMDGHPPDAVLMWFAGALATGLLNRSNAVLAAAAGLLATWVGMEQSTTLAIFSDYTSPVVWTFLPLWALVAAGFAVTRWRPGLHIAALTLCYWIVMSAFAYRAGRDIGPFGIVTVIGISFCALSILAGPVIDRWRNISGAILFYGFGLAFCGAFGMQFIANQGGHYILTFGILVLAVIVGVLAWAWRTDNRSVLWLAYAAFSVEIFALYLKKIGTLLGTSAFFLVAGLILAVLAYIATRMHGAAPARAGGAA